MGKLKWSLAEIDPRMVKKFEKALVDDGLIYREWLYIQIENYLKKKNMIKPWDKLTFIRKPLKKP